MSSIRIWTSVRSVMAAKRFLHRWSALALLWLLAVLKISTCCAAEVVQKADTDDGLRVVVSARALKPEGRSHWHLYLYNSQGKLLRTLTRGEGFDHVNPVFSPDGKTIIFQRMPATFRREPDIARARTFELSSDSWEVEPYDGKTTAPEWYLSTEKLKSMDYSNEWRADAQAALDENTTVSFAEPTGRYELLVTLAGESGWMDRDVELKTLRTGEKHLFSSMPGYGASLAGDGSFGFADFLSDNGKIWVHRGRLLTIVFNCHLNSTDGTAYFALDPERRRIHELSPNSAEVFLVGSLPYFFVLCQERYQPIGDGLTTANCLYLDVWGTNFQRRRMAPKLSIFGGAGIYAPDHRPQTFHIMRESY